LGLFPQIGDVATTAKSEARRKGRSTQGRADGIRFDWDNHGCDGYAVPVQERSHEDSGDLIAAKIRRDWDEEADAADEADESESDEG